MQRQEQKLMEWRDVVGDGLLQIHFACPEEGKHGKKEKRRGETACRRPGEEAQPEQMCLEKWNGKAQGRGHQKHVDIWDRDGVLEMLVMIMMALQKFILQLCHQPGSGSRCLKMPYNFTLNDWNVSTGMMGSFQLDSLSLIPSWWFLFGDVSGNTRTCSTGPEVDCIARDNH